MTVSVYSFKIFPSLLPIITNLKLHYIIMATIKPPALQMKRLINNSSSNHCEHNELTSRCRAVCSLNKRALFTCSSNSTNGHRNHSADSFLSQFNQACSFWNYLSVFILLPHFPYRRKQRSVLLFLRPQYLYAAHISATRFTCPTNSLFVNVCRTRKDTNLCSQRYDVINTPSICGCRSKVSNFTTC
jgi:hypothetical protein